MHMEYFYRDEGFHIISWADEISFSSDNPVVLD